MSLHQTDVSRRNFLFAASSFVAAAMLPAQALAASSRSGVHIPGEISQFWESPREIWLARKATGEQEKLVFWRDGKLDYQGYLKACHLLRDVSAGQMVQMDVGLLNIFRAIQGWLAYYNINEPIVITSGYRTPRTNAKTEGSVRNSYHTRGAGGDIVIPGIPAKYLSDLAASFKGGGIGFYASKNFVHTDTGPVRRWRG
jgi:uncharacterized protein YcbK (DUF882 family)